MYLQLYDVNLPYQALQRVQAHIRHRPVKVKVQAAPVGLKLLSCALLLHVTAVFHVPRCDAPPTSWLSPSPTDCCRS